MPGESTLPRGRHRDHSAPTLLLVSDCRLCLLLPHLPCEGSSPGASHSGPRPLKSTHGPFPMKPKASPQPMSFASHRPYVSLKPPRGDGLAIKHMQARRWMRIRLEMSHEPGGGSSQSGCMNTGAMTPSTCLLAKVEVTPVYVWVLERKPTPAPPGLRKSPKHSSADP